MAKRKVLDTRNGPVFCTPIHLDISPFGASSPSLRCPLMADRFFCCVCFLLWFPRVAKQISFHTRPKPSRIHHKFAVTSTSSGIQPPDPVMIISTEASVTNCQCPSLHPRSVATMLQSSTGRRNPPAAACCKQPVSNRACSCKTRPPGFSEI